jgi:hypothetical protein
MLYLGLVVAQLALKSCIVGKAVLMYDAATSLSWIFLIVCVLPLSRQLFGLAEKSAEKSFPAKTSTHHFQQHSITLFEIHR